MNLIKIGYTQCVYLHSWAQYENELKMTLITKRTIIKPLTEKDIPNVIIMYKEPDSFKYVKPFAGKSDVFYTEFLKKKIESNIKEVGFWTVCKKENNEFIGTVNLNQFASTSMSQVGCHLKRKFWNNGYASELLKEIVGYGIEQRKLREIYGIFEEENIASRKLLEKLQFEHFEKKTILNTKVNIHKYCAQQWL